MSVKVALEGHILKMCPLVFPQPAGRGKLDVMAWESGISLGTGIGNRPDGHHEG